MKKILVTRTDRLGDVLLATPVLRRLRELYPEASIAFLVQKMWMPVLNLDGITLMEYRPEERADVLTERLKKESFDVAVVLRDERTVTQAVRKSKIPVRIGPYSSLRSFFAFNRGKRQRRSECKMHEAEYNLDLLSRLGAPAVEPAKGAVDLPRSWVKVSAEAVSNLQTWLRENDLTAGEYICLHPGSSGSARYLSTETLKELVRGLLQAGHRVVLTGSQAESALLNEIAHQGQDSSTVRSVLIFGGEQGTRPLDELAALYQNAKLVIAHGTGPLHLAAAVGSPVFAVFPPIFVLSERRWGPLVSERVVWTPPEVSCPEKYHCQGPRCSYYDCMNRFEVQSVLKTVQSLLTQG